MVDAATVRRLALSLPEVSAGPEPDRLSFAVAGKPIAWTFLERLRPKAPRQPRLDILAVRCAIERKEMLIEAAPDTYFDDDHYSGYPAVLVRLAAIAEADLEALLRGAWTIQAPARLRKTFDADKERPE
jgi:hypothetical protein